MKTSQGSNVSSSSTISTSAMESIVMKLKNERNRSSTRKNYYGIWKTFNQFFVKLDRKPDSWEERLILFVGFLIEDGKKSSTVKSYVSAVKGVLREDGTEINEDRFLLNSLTRACKYHNDKVRTRLPIKKGLLQLIIQSVPQVFEAEQPYLVCLYRALFVTTYFGLFRVGEMTESTHVVRAKDVHIGKNKSKIMFVLHTSKTHWSDMKPQIIKISASDDDKDEIQLGNIMMCPFSLLTEYMQLRSKRASDEEQFFVFKDRTPVTAYNFRSILRKTLTILGLDSSLYGTQSIRSGRSVDLLAQGFSVETIRKIGRWESSAIYTYLKY